MNVNPFSYLIEKLKGKVDKSGDTMTGDLNVDTGTSTNSFITIGGSLNYGTLRIKAGNTGKYGEIHIRPLTQNRNYVLPDQTGVVALTSDIPVPQLTSSPKTGMAGGWYVVWDLSTSWATDVSLWVQVASGTHVYVWTQNTLVTLA